MELVLIQNPVKLNRTELLSMDFKILHVWVARFFCLYLTHEWFIFGTHSDTNNPYTLRIMFSAVPKAFLFFTIGLWLSTTQWGFRHKKMVYFLLLPSLIMSPSIIGFPLSIMSWLSFFVAIWSYVIIYRTKGKN